ncbi:transcription factor TGA2.2-like [Dioscorea cayenensis subsp. rotundata]|uniref:Transcription factor TGA2.2-like n=1 Tax=Dioscorea cayennensis subsp. rotundata TaxID=55577 RepID=A0AB40BWF7_DIOCR|nr:transcription factor TGA2.2-like [Dioscorea cayenensis subsp. rotundata]
MGSRRGGVGVGNNNEFDLVMPSFVSSTSVALPVSTEGNNTQAAPVSGYGGVEQSVGLRRIDTVDLSISPLLDPKSTSLAINSDSHQFTGFNKTFTLPEITASARVGSFTLPEKKDQRPNLVSLLSGHLENWGDSTMADSSPRTDTNEQGQHAAVGASDSSGRSKDKTDQKTLRRLAQNREAARKSRLRKKAYVQQLESSRLKLTQLEQELHRARQQGIFISNSGDQAHSMNGNGALTFDVEYARWLEEHSRQIGDLRNAVNSHASDVDLRVTVDGVMAHYDEIFKLKGAAAKADVFYMLSGMWKTPAERCFMWLGGFRSSELLKLLVSQLEPLTEQQLVGICNLQQSSQQAEDALSQGMDALQQSLAETLASGSLGPSGSSGNVANYMGQMAMAMGKLGTLENFLRQADNLRQQTLQQMHRILTVRQSARALLAISDYFSRLRALSSLWLARPRE